MTKLLNGFSKSPSIISISATFIIFVSPLLLVFDALAQPDEDTLIQSVNLSAEPTYSNYAKKGSYENETMFSEVPQWHYYDMFGNKILDGFYMYGLSKGRNTMATGTDNLALHPLFLRWLNGMVQVGDLQEDFGILALIGDRVTSKFTPFTFNQSLFAGARYDAYYKQTTLTFLTNRISSTGDYGLITEFLTQTLTSDWLTGLHATHQFGDMAHVGGSYVNIHHEEAKNFSNPFSGVDYDTLTKKSPTGLSLLGLDLNLNFNNLLANGELLRSQEFLDGDFKPKSGTVAMLNARYDMMEKLRLGSELYTIGSRFQTNFTCLAPGHVNGDAKITDPMTGSMGKYQYSLIEDNDDNDEFPENGRSRYTMYTMYGIPGDPDGAIPVFYDKNKNGIYDNEEDFLSYETDPPESKILFDRNNNGTADEVEDDAYPDYPYVPSYYLPGERYYRYDDVDTMWESKRADSLTHKGLAGVHLYTRYNLLQNLELTLGGIFDKSQENTFQRKYDANGQAIGEEYASENATSIYVLAHYKNELARDKYLKIDNLMRKVQDNIPNHTVGYLIDPALGTGTYYLIPDTLDNRDMFSNALRAEFSLFQNRGLNYTSVGRYEFEKRFPHIEFNYLDETVTSFILINKCEYVFLLPFFKDMFLIPKYKNYWETQGSSRDIADSLNPYTRNVMTNTAYLVLEWKMSEKTALTGGLHLKRFDDFNDDGENYFEALKKWGIPFPCWSIQLMMKDRYAGMSLVLTTGFSRFGYTFDLPGLHNPINNPRGAVSNITAHEFFIKLHAGI
jgi:hypothetical protein